MVFIIHKIALLEKAVLRFWPAVCTQQSDPLIVEVLGNRRGLVCCVSYHQSDWQVLQLFHQTLEGSSVIFISRVYAVA